MTPVVYDAAVLVSRIIRAGMPIAVAQQPRELRTDD
jgi:hypothetical protein